MPIMTTYTREDDVIPPGVDDAEIATKKQTQMNIDVTEHMTNQKNAMDLLNQNLDVVISELRNIKTNTGKTNKGIGAIADTQ